MDQYAKDTIQPAGGIEEIEEIKILEGQLQGVNGLPIELADKSMAMLDRLKRVAKYGHFSNEYEPIAKYISWITKIPWTSYTEDNLDLENTKKQLDSTHYGLLDVKERVLEYIAMLNLRMELSLIHI